MSVVNSIVYCAQTDRRVVEYFIGARHSTTKAHRKKMRSKFIKTSKGIERSKIANTKKAIVDSMVDQKLSRNSEGLCVRIKSSGRKKNGRLRIVSLIAGNDQS